MHASVYVTRSTKSRERDENVERGTKKTGPFRRALPRPQNVSEINENY